MSCEVASAGLPSTGRGVRGFLFLKAKDPITARLATVVPKSTVTKLLCKTLTTPMSPARPACGSAPFPVATCR